MNDKNNNSRQSGEQNPTLNSPGAKVADYGNPTGGSANSEEETQSKNEKSSGENAPPHSTGETQGNP